MKRTLSFLLLLLTLAFSAPQFASAQGTPSEGKDYYLGFLYPSFNRVIPAFSSGFFRVYAIISSFQDNTAYVSYFDESGVEQAATPYKIPKRKAVQVVLQTSMMKMTDPGDLLKEYKAVHITAKKPINVQFFSTGGSSCGMYLCLPTNGLGTKYVTANYFDNPEGINAMLGGRGPSEVDEACGYFMIIGAYNGTSVQITPASTTQGGKHTGATNGPGASGVGVPYTISLNRGQCYMVKSHCGSGDNDISGSIIESDKPVAVISGHENVGLGSVGSRSLEGRDFMVEQMMPVDYWDNTGYISIPMVDSSPMSPDGGLGENFRTYTYDPNGAQINMQINGFAGVTSMDVGRFFNREKFEVEAPATFSSPNGRKFSVFQIDAANHSSKEPYPRPSMMTIIPKSRWRNAYLWFVPSNVDERLQAYYINVIGPKDNKLFDSIYISKNGQKDVPIRQAGMSQVGQYNSIPGYPELKGVRYKVVPGSYYARAQFPFMIYHYGNRAIDADGDLGDFDNDDNFFSYALPLGAVLSNGDTAIMTIKVDTLCAGWRICATDHRPNGGIKSAILVDDPEKDILVPPPGHDPYQYYNTAFTPDKDPNNTGEINFDDPDSTSCFDVVVNNIGKDGYAPILITDNGGNGKLIELYYKKASVAYSPLPDSVTDFGIQYVLDVKDSTFLFINKKGSQKPYQITEVDLLKDVPAFSIVSVEPPLPVTLSPDDTFKIKVRFTHNDTGYFFDSLKMVTDCFTTYWPIEGTVGTGLIVASDHDFGNVVVGETRCTDTITVRNVGNMPFTLTKDWILHDNVDFSFDPNRIRVGNRDEKLPVVIPPGGFVKIVACFTPHAEGTDSTDLDHGTDIRTPYERSIKAYSHLRGNGIKPGVNWDVPQDSLIVTCDEEVIHRRWLINTGTATVNVDTVEIVGIDKAEFRIVGFQDLPETGIDTGARVWVDIAFKADLSKPFSYIRRAQLRATSTTDTNDRIVELYGKVLHAEIALNPTTTIELGNIDFGVRTPVGFTLSNPGDAPLIITGAIFPNPEVDSIFPALSFPDTIAPGDLKLYTVQILSNKYTDTTIAIIFQSSSLCSPPDTVFVHYVVSNRKVATTGFQSTPTYVDCRESLYDVSITNEGTVPLNLLYAEIINQAPTYNDADQFVFQENMSQKITFPTPIVLAPRNGTHSIPTLFKPTRTGPLSARVKFVYDSAGTVKDSVMDIVQGPGVKLANILSAQNPAGVGVNYVVKTGEIFRLPLRFTEAIELPAGAYGVRVNVRYKRDVLHYRDIVDGVNGYGPTPSNPAAVYNNDGTETVTVTVMNGQQILNPGVFAEIPFQVMVAKDSLSDIILTDGEFLDANGATLCYFDKQYVPGQFAAEYQCGDETISDNFDGILPTRIVQLTPNPSTPAGNIKVIYDVNVDELPVTIELFNVLGANVKTIQTTSRLRKGTHKASFDTQGIPAGTYTLRITSPESSQTETFIIGK